jgi:hypothetical protein
MSCPSQSSWLHHPNDICWGVQSIKLLVMQSSPIPCYLIPIISYFWGTYLLATWSIGLSEVLS